MEAVQFIRNSVLCSRVVVPVPVATSTETEPALLSTSSDMIGVGTKSTDVVILFFCSCWLSIIEN